MSADKAGDALKPVAWMYKAHTPDGVKRVLVHRRSTHYDGYAVSDETPLYTRPDDHAAVLAEALRGILDDSYVGKAGQVVSTRSKWANYPAHRYYEGLAALQQYEARND